MWIHQRTNEKQKAHIESQFENKLKNVGLKKISVKKVGHNSEPTQEQNCYCESIKELMKNKKHTYSHNLKIN